MAETKRADSRSEQEKVADHNAFAARKHPGMVGVEILRCSKEEVTGQFTVSDRTIALFRCTQMILSRG